MTEETPPTELCIRIGDKDYRLRDGAKYITEGTHIALYPPGNSPEGLLVIHPEHPPKIVYWDGRFEELEASVNGTQLYLPPQAVSSADLVLEIGHLGDVTSWADDPDVVKVVVDMATPGGALQVGDEG